MQYGMTFDTPREGDEVFEQHGLKVIVDPTSMFYVNGASIDYVDNLMGGGFHIEKPPMQPARAVAAAASAPPRATLAKRCPAVAVINRQQRIEKGTNV